MAMYIDPDREREMRQRAIEVLRAIQRESSSLQKQHLLRENKDNTMLLRLLYYALNPLISYKISENTIRKTPAPSTSDEPLFRDIFDVCESLSKKKALDDATVQKVQQFISSVASNDDAELYIKLLSKTMRIGMTAKTVNKIVPGLIPVWEVQQAYPIDKYPIKSGTWFSLSEKLNGVRATFYDGELVARSGAAYTGLEHITSILSSISFGESQSLVFDGELTLCDKGSMSDNEAFRVATGIINSDGTNKTSICYTIFDILPLDEFNLGESKATYRQRREMLDMLSNQLGDSQFVRVLPSLYSGTDPEAISPLLDRMVAEDKEGLVANLDVPYRCKRHNGILKIKQFYTMDLPILFAEEGSGRLTGTLGALVLDYLGNEVRVGSGFSDEQRTLFWQQRDQLAGELCEVKYKETSSDKKTGAPSLQFPTFVCVRTDKNDVSYG